MNFDPLDTIVARSSAVGGAARAVVRLSGPRALKLSLDLFRADAPIEPDRRGLHAGEVRVPGLPGWPADLYLWPGPRTYTGQDLVELHTIGSPPLVEALIAALLAGGARAAEPGEFTLRAFLAGKLDLPAVEAVLAVIDAPGRAQLADALNQLAGGLTTPLHALRDDLLSLRADVEAGLDFSDEDIEIVAQRDMLDRLTRALAHLTVLQRQLASRALSERPFRAVLSGPPNAGKSSLFNALASAEAALVSPTPGTTRDYLVHRLELEEVTLELIDTAGLRESDDAIESQARRHAEEQAGNAELVLWCQAANAPTPPPAAGNVIVLATKCDLASATKEAVLATSAVSGAGLDQLRALLVDKARQQSATPLAPSLSRCRQHVHACLEHLRQAHAVVLHEDPPELLAVELRGALDQLGAMVGAIYTDDLLDRIFSRFCIGK